jgi:hypothetical protein
VSRKRLVAPVLALVAFLVVGESGSQATHRPQHKAPRCALRGSSTIYRDGAVRVYSKAFPDESEKTYGCLFSANKRVQLAQSYGPDNYVALEYLHSARPYIAFSLDDAEKGVASAPPVYVVNLRTGSKRSWQAFNYVQGVGLTRHGSVAWMDPPPDVTGYAIHKLEAGAKEAVTLDSGTGIDPTSFAVGGHFIYWTKAGAPKSATMP